MAACEMCGAGGQMFITIIEGAQLSVCKNCSTLGKVLKDGTSTLPKEKKKQSLSAKPLLQTRIIHVIAGDYAKRIRQAREKSGLSQKEFAMKLNERESFIQHLENGQSPPRVDTARKLERMLGIQLIEEIKEEAPSGGDEDEKAPSAGTLTLGDVIKIRKR